MKRTLMPGLMMAIGLLLAACGQPVIPTAALPEMKMAVRVEPETLAVGATTLIVTLKDAAGAPVDGARLRVHGDMDHQGMMPVEREISDGTNGEYRVPFEWTMGGGWVVTITAQLPDNGGEISQTYNFFVEAVSGQSIIGRSSTAVATAETTAAHSTADESPVHIVYASDRYPAVAGDATVTVALADQEGIPITNANVQVTGEMAHHGMLPISGTGEHTANGQYVVPMRWTMAGDWIVTVKVTLANGDQIEQVFDQQVVMP